MTFVAHSQTHRQIVEVLGGAGLVALAVAVGALVYLHLVPSGLSPLRNAVSQYGIGPYRNGYRCQTVAFAVAALALAWAFAVEFHGRGVTTLVALTLVFAVARALISWSPMDEPGGVPTPAGRRHGLLAIVTFVSIWGAAARLGGVASASGQWAGLAGVSTALAWVMGVTIATMFAARWNEGLRRLFGLVERVLYLSIITWLAVFLVACVAQPH